MMRIPRDLQSDDGPASEATSDAWYTDSLALSRVLAIAGGAFSPGEPGRYRALVDGLLNADPYLLLADFADYLAAQARVDALYRDPAAWNACALRNVAGMGFFSTDRTVREYTERVWTASTPAVG